MKETSANKTQENEVRKYFLAEFSLDDGEYEITFNIVDISFVYETVTVVITDNGKITQDTFQLMKDKNDRYYFEYGRFYEKKVYIDDFDEVNGNE